MATDSRRLSILSAQEIEGLYGLPRFTEDDRQVFFDLSPVEREVVDAVHAISTAVQLCIRQARLMPTFDDGGWKAEYEGDTARAV